MPSSVNIEPQNGAKAIATRIEPITDHTKDEYDKDTDTDLSNSIDNSDKSCTEINEKDVSPSPTCVASVYN